MTTISINLENFKRFSKRLQKEQNKLGFEQSLTESQEMLAKTLGFSNYFEFHKKFNEQKPEKDTESSVNLYKEYLLKLKEILDRDGSEISKCFFQYDEHQKKNYMQLESKSGYAIGLDFDRLTKNLFSITKKHFDYEDINLIQRLNDEYFDKKIHGKFWIYDEIPFYDANNEIHYYATEVPILNGILYREAKKIFVTVNNCAILKCVLNESERKIDNKYYRNFYAEVSDDGNILVKNGMFGFSDEKSMWSFKECNHNKKFKELYINIFDKKDIIETNNIY